MVWLLVGGVAALLTSFGFVPQVLKMWHTRSVGDLSVATLLQFLTGILLWTAHALHTGDPVLILSNLLSLGVVTVAVVLYFRFLGKVHPFQFLQRYKDHIEALSGGSHLEEGYEGGLGSDGHDSLLFDGIHVNGLQHGAQEFPSFSQVGLLPQIGEVLQEPAGLSGKLGPKRS